MEWKTYIGKEGFKDAVKKLKEIKKRTNKIPSIKHKEVKGIVSAIKRGDWKVYGIDRCTSVSYLNLLLPFSFTLSIFKDKRKKTHSFFS